MKKLRDGVKLSAEEKDWVNRFDIALDKMPKYNGTVNRSLTFISEEVREGFFRELNKGRMRFQAYTSASKRVHDPDDQVRMVIHAKAAADLEKYNPGEQEAIFKRNTEFKITKVETTPDKVIIYAEEL